MFSICYTLFTGANSKVFRTLSEPVCPHLYFAGEYTSEDSIFTAHGAYNSGVRAAQQVITNHCENVAKKKQKKESQTKIDEQQKKNLKKKNKQQDKKEKRDEL